MGRHTSDSSRHLRGTLVTALLRALGRLPYPLGRRLGLLLGALLWWLPNKGKRVARVNLQMCLPQLSDASQQRLCQHVLKENVAGMIELAWVWQHPQQALARVAAVENGEQLRETLASGRPALILAPHIGCWEVLNFWLSQHFPMHAMFNPSGLPALDDLIRAGREQFGTVLHPATARGVVSLVRALKQHDGDMASLSAILPDQVPDRRSGRFAPFFGQPAATGTLPVKLLQQSGARAFMAFAKRTGDGQFEIRLRDPDERIYDADVDTALAGLNASIEALIMEAPAQYLWTYQRFRRVPEGEKKPY
ncbi:MAG: lysophospholipid acyltransferase family protein [Alcanivoracaceae bacterium]|nr:lysophospholipid acyltransferase family protein [Alcanivoracaceae bacterium]